MKLNGILFAFFGLMLLLGGLMGYLKAGSTPSLIAGGLLGVGTLTLAIFTLKKSIISENIALVTTLLIDIFFAYRVLQTRSFFPAGAMTLISSLVVITACLSIKKRLSKTLN